MINIFFSIFLFSLLWDNNQDIIVSTDKRQYNNREKISIVIQNNSYTNKWSYIGLETRFNGEWEEINLDILTNMQKTVKLHKIKKTSKSIFQYLPSKIDSVYFLNNKGEFRLKVTFGESPEKINKEVYSLPIIINREISQMNIK